MGAQLGNSGENEKNGDLKICINPKMLNKYLISYSVLISSLNLIIAKLTSVCSI